MLNNLLPHYGVFIGRLLSRPQNHVTCIDQLHDSSPVYTVMSGVTLDTTEISFSYRRYR